MKPEWQDLIDRKVRNEMTDQDVIKWSELSEVPEFAELYSNTLGLVDAFRSQSRQQDKELVKQIAKDHKKKNLRKKIGLYAISILLVFFVAIYFLIKNSDDVTDYAIADLYPKPTNTLSPTTRDAGNIEDDIQKAMSAYDKGQYDLAFQSLSLDPKSDNKEIQYFAAISAMYADSLGQAEQIFQRLQSSGYRTEDVEFYGSLILFKRGLEEEGKKVLYSIESQNGKHAKSASRILRSLD